MNVVNKHILGERTDTILIFRSHHAHTLQILIAAQDMLPPLGRRYNDTHCWMAVIKFGPTSTLVLILINAKRYKHKSIMAYEYECKP